MKAIETKYAGHRFRSRLEARWAVFFDAAGIEWTYEPQGYEFEDGTRYLPDFLLRNAMCSDWGPQDVYAEVKGEMTPDDAAKITQLSKHHGVVILGDLPRHRRRRSYVFVSPYRTTRKEWVHCFGGSAQSPEGSYLCGPYEYDFVSPVEHEAFDRARSARFEFGEEG